MSICLCGESAEKILNLIALKRLSAYGTCGAEVLETCRSGRREVESALEGLPHLERPVHVLVGNPQYRMDRSFSKSHLWTGPIASDSLVRITPNAYAARPEFNALLEMRCRTLVERTLVLMGYCGIFAIDEGSEDGFVKRPQLTNVRSLERYSARMGRPAQTDCLIDALPFVLERARSPLEARLALALTLPTRMRGLGIEKPLLNSSISLGQTGRAIVGASSLDGDLVWTDRRVVLEANGRLRHEMRFGEDLTRASALESEGYSVRLVTSQQLRSARQMLVLGRWLAERLGVEPSFPERHDLQELLNEINGFSYHRYAL